MTQMGDEVDPAGGHEVFEQGPILPRGIPVGMVVLVAFVSVLAAISEHGLDVPGFHDVHDDSGIHLVVFRSFERAHGVVLNALSLRGVDGWAADACHLDAGSVWHSADAARSVTVRRSDDGLVVTDSAAGRGGGVVDDDALGRLTASVLAG